MRVKIGEISKTGLKIYLMLFLKYLTMIVVMGGIIGTQLGTGCEIGQLHLLLVLQAYLFYRAKSFIRKSFFVKKIDLNRSDPPIA